MSTGFDQHYRTSSSSPGDIRRHYADISKATRPIGFEPKVGLREGVQRYVDWLRRSEFDPSEMLGARKAAELGVNVQDTEKIKDFWDSRASTTVCPSRRSLIAISGSAGWKSK